MKLCHHCGREQQLAGPVGRTDSCPHCKSDLKVCMNCRFFDPSASNQCREPQVEWVSDKAKANFCEFFVYVQVQSLDQPGAPGTQKDQARAAFDALFKKR